MRIYTYTGNDFTSATSPYTTSDSITGELTLSSALAGGLTNEDVTADVTSFDFFDGVNPYDSADGAGLVTFQVSTDSQGDITDWIVFAISQYGEMRTCDGGTGIFGCGSAIDISYDGASGSTPSNQSDQGTWLATAVSDAPEPSSFGLLALGILPLIARHIRRGA